MVRLRPTLEFRRGDELVTHVLALPGAIWFQGHFPSAPLLPGVAMLAMVAESVELFWSDALHPALRIESLRRVRFRQRVEPGANLRVHIRQTQPQTLRFTVEVGGLAACTGECSVVAEPSSGGLRRPRVDMSAQPWSGRALPDIEKILAALDRVQDAVVKPRRLRCVPAIPTTSVGKRDRVAILKLLAVPTREPTGK